MSKLGNYVAVAAVSVLLPICAHAQRDNLSARDRPLDMEVGVTSGVNGWTGDLGENTAAGPYAGVQVLQNIAPVLAVEAGYEGSRNLIDGDDRVTSGAGIWRHNVSVGARLGMPLERAKPYAGVGVGVSYLDPNDRAGDVYRTDLITEIPVSAGLDYSLGRGVLLGARATYRFIGDEEFLNAADGETDGALLSAGLGLSGRF